MNTNLECVRQTIKSIIKKHHELVAKSGEFSDWERGFCAGLDYVQEYILPTYETLELEKSAAVVKQMEGEIEDLKFKHKLGIK